MTDVYCERSGPGLGAEPINVTTNAVFFLAAWALWRLARKRRTRTNGVCLLIALVVAIGTGSALFHAFATHWARVLDFVPILLFELAYLWIYCRQMAGMSLPKAGALLGVYLAAAYLAGRFPRLFNGSLVYAPAFVLLLGLGLYHLYHGKNERSLLLGAAGLFGVSLFFRTIDNGICPIFPVGTHFLWHVSNGFVLYLSMRGLMVNLQRGSERQGGPSG